MSLGGIDPRPYNLVFFFEDALSGWLLHSAPRVAVGHAVYDVRSAARAVLLVAHARPARYSATATAGSLTGKTRVKRNGKRP